MKQSKTTARAARMSDPLESKKAELNTRYKRGSQRYQLLYAYCLGAVWNTAHGKMLGALNLTDEEAGHLVFETWAVTIRNPHKRCSELKKDGFIEQTGTKMGEFGQEVRVCAVTEKGLLEYERQYKQEQACRM